MPEKLFFLALKNENNGDLKLALANYESALTESKKSKRNKDLGEKIREKIKVLQTVIQYQNGLS